MSQEQSKLTLDKANAQLGLRSNSPVDADRDAFDTPESSLFASESALVPEQTEDSHPPEKNPLIRGAIVFIILVPVGLLIALLTWGGIVNSAKKTDTLKDPTATAEVNASDKDKELAQVKVELAMAQQKERAAKLTQAATENKPAPIVTATPDPNSNVATKPATENFPPKPGSVPATAATTDTVRLQQETAKLNSAKSQAATELNVIARTRQQEAAQLTATKQSLQQEKTKLDAARRDRFNESSKVVKLQNDARILADRLKALNAKATAANRTALAPIRPVVTAYRPAPITPSDSYVPKPQVRAREMSWDETAALSLYGGRGQETSAPLATPVIATPPNVVSSSSGTMTLPAGASVPGRVVSPYYTLVGGSEYQYQQRGQTDKKTMTVVLDREIEVAAGWSLSKGTTIEFAIDVASNGLVEATSGRVVVKGVEVNIPAGTFILSAPSGNPLRARIDNFNSEALQSAEFNATVYGTLNEVGKALLNGNTTVTIGNGATIAQSSPNGNSVLGAVLSGVTNYAVQNNAERARALAAELNQQAKIAAIAPNTQVTIYVSRSASFNPPIR